MAMYCVTALRVISDRLTLSFSANRSTCSLTFNGNIVITGAVFRSCAFTFFPMLWLLLVQKPDTMRPVALGCTVPGSSGDVRFVRSPEVVTDDQLLSDAFSSINTEQQRPHIFVNQYCVDLRFGAPAPRVA
jgi:hypothetical protein